MRYVVSVKNPHSGLFGDFSYSTLTITSREMRSFCYLFIGLLSNNKEIFRQQQQQI